MQSQLDQKQSDKIDKICDQQGLTHQVGEYKKKLKTKILEAIHNQNGVMFNDEIRAKIQQFTIDLAIKESKK